MTTAKISLRINRGVVSQKRTEFTAAAAAAAAAAETITIYIILTKY